MCQECFWPGSAQALEEEIELWLIFFIFLDKPASNPETGELGKGDFPPLFGLFYPFAVGFLGGFWISWWFFDFLGLFYLLVVF